MKVVLVVPMIVMMLDQDYQVEMENEVNEVMGNDLLHLKLITKHRKQLHNNIDNVMTT
jgi:hypothetical protein